MIWLLECIVPANRLMAEAHAIAAMVLKGAPEAVRQTKRLLVVHEAVEVGGFGAEIVARVIDQLVTANVKVEPQSPVRRWLSVRTRG